MLGQILTSIPFPDWLSPNVFSIGSFSLKWYGLAYIAGWFLALLYAKSVVKRHELFTPAGLGKGFTRGVTKVPGPRVLEDYAFWLLVGIIVGGRIGSIILYNPGRYLDDPLAALRVWEGGMAFHGGFLGVALALILFARWKKYEIFRMADMAAIGAPFGLFLGRLANFVNQELWGHPTDMPWAFIFDTDGRGLPRHPSQLYEAALEGVALWLIIFVLTRKFRILAKPGIATGTFIAGYGVFRMIVEQFRVPDADLIFGMTRGTAYSLPMVIVGALVILWAVKRKAVEPSFATETVPADTETA